MIETIAHFRRWFHFGMAALTLALMLVLMPAGVWAAPYAACVLVARTGEVLYEQNADARLHRDRLADAVARFNELTILTTHSFCQTMLHELGYENMPETLDGVAS